MKRLFYFMLSLSMPLLLASCGGGASSNQAEQKSDSTQVEQSGKFKLGNGVNVSHWLSQSDRRGEERAKQIVKADFDSIAAMGFDHVRIPVDEVQLYDDSLNRYEDAFQLLKNAIDWSLEDGLNVIVDLHVIRSFHFNNENGRPNTLFTDPAAQENMVKVWLDLQQFLKVYPNDRVAYELLNEVSAPTHEAWNQLIEKNIKALRQEEPNRMIVVGSNWAQTIAAFDSLRVPEGDKNLIVSFHYYSPLLITHYGAPWSDASLYKGKVTYPGLPIADTSCYKDMKPEDVAKIRVHNVAYNRDSMARDMMHAIEMAKDWGLELYCGEFGSYPRFIDQETRLRWYNDLVSIFRQYNINNAHWCYKGDFPVVKEDGSANELPALLTKK
ncbi:MAG: cellulase family glycosylhydrolase [Paludibacteraceae bacterium]|nr:cellulase family glycosylhydrolase [Paludibacteraceae bacterium]